MRHRTAQEGNLPHPRLADIGNKGTAPGEQALILVAQDRTADPLLAVWNRKRIHR